MKTGTVALWRNDFGFISPSDGGSDVFCYFDSIEGQEGFRKLERGQKVSFDVEIGPKGKPQAAHVRVIQPPTEKEEDAKWNRL